MLSNMGATSQPHVFMLNINANSLKRNKINISIPQPHIKPQ